MNKNTLQLGRSQQNDKVFPQGDVSSVHARITRIGEDEYEVEDLDSSNGTYINGYRIKKAKISSRDQLRLSAGVVVDVPALFGAPSKIPEAPKTNNNYVREFAELRPIYEKYKSERRNLRKKHQQKLSLIRGAITFSPILVLIIWIVLTGQDQGKARAELGFGIMGFSILGSTIAGFFTSGITIEDELENMDEGFRARYVCPNKKCGHQLGVQSSWTQYYNTGHCIKCGAIYNEKKL